MPEGQDKQYGGQVSGDRSEPRASERKLQPSQHQSSLSMRDENRNQNGKQVKDSYHKIVLGFNL